MDPNAGKLAMSDTAAELANLKKMHNKGVLSLEQNGEKVTFASGAELRTRIAILEAQLQREQSGAASSGFHYPVFDKGV